MQNQPASNLIEHGRDIYDINIIAQEIIDYTGQTETEVWKRLARELDRNGTNVMAETRRFGVTPHVFDENLIKFYTESDGFIYETCVESRHPYRMAKWLKIAEFIGQTSKPKEKCDVLLYGDSVGNDSIFLRRMGFNVFYHDYDGYCSRFAKERFKRRNLFIQSFSPNTVREFDYIVCFEVAEHVPDPIALVAELAKLTAPNGYCIFSESFGLLKEQFPTHLASNLKYVGQADEMFRQQDMYVAWRDEHDKPIVYTKIRPPAESGKRLLKKARRAAGRIKRAVTG
jgi:2-polyprenyl-3-methyl-5-hydroxy-6-metoxy-1,4-benzoquinol methylase